MFVAMYVSGEMDAGILMLTLKSHSRCSSPGSRRAGTAGFRVCGCRRRTPCPPRATGARPRSVDPFPLCRISAMTIKRAKAERERGEARHSAAAAEAGRGRSRTAQHSSCCCCRSCSAATSSFLDSIGGGIARPAATARRTPRRPS